MDLDEVVNVQDTEGGKREWKNQEISSTEDQSTNLPELGDYTLYRFAKDLTDPTDFELWLKATKSTLEGIGLDRLINLSLKRPLRDSPDGDKWYRTSRLVKNWMADNISLDLCSRIMGQSEDDLIFADEFIFTMKQLFKRPTTAAALEHVKKLV